MTRLLADRNAVHVHTLEENSRPSAGGFDGTLCLAAFNIAHGRGTNASNWSDREVRQHRLKEIAGLLRREKVDIAVLNEVDFDAAWTGHENQAEILAREAGFPHVMQQRNFDVAFPFFRLRSGNAVLSRFPIASAEFVKLPPRSAWEQRLAGSKQGSFADIQVDQATAIRLFAVHLEWRDEPTRISSGEILSKCAANSPFPFFCVGDFNCSPAFAKQASAPPEPSTLDMLLSNSTLHTLATTPLTPADFTFSSVAPTRAIDWILIPPGWEFVSYHVLDVQLSDHRPVIAQVRRQTLR